MVFENAQQVGNVSYDGADYQFEVSLHSSVSLLLIKKEQMCCWMMEISTSLTP